MGGKTEFISTGVSQNRIISGVEGTSEAVESSYVPQAGILRAGSSLLRKSQAKAL